MVRLIVRTKSYQGMTLIETLIALVIAGILAAFTLPSMMGILKGNELKAAQDQVQSALRDAQRQAIRRSKKCTINFSSGDPVGITANDNDCLSTVDRALPKGITLTSSNGKSFTYSFKGHTNNAATLTLSSPKGTGVKRCIAVAANLGIMRSGIVNTNGECVTTSSTL